MDIAKGNVNVYSAMQLTHDMQGLDKQSKLMIRQKPVIANILQAVAEEYMDLSKDEIIDLLEYADIDDDVEVSSGRTNSDTIKGVNTEFAELHEMLSKFDSRFTVKNPRLSTKDILVNIHFDIEPQKDYKPGYPIEKRGIYYLARELSSEIPVVTENTDYNILEKCYSIWICRDNVPKDERYTISKYKIKNVSDNIMDESIYDLMELVIIRLGNKVWNGGDGIFDFLNLIFYPHGSDFEERFGKYIDLKQYEDLKKEVSKVRGLGESVYMDGVTDGRTQEIVRIVIKKVKKNHDLNSIADAIEEDIEYVRPIYNAVLENAKLDDEGIIGILKDRQMI